MGNINSGARRNNHPCWSGGLRRLNSVDDILNISQEDTDHMKRWVRGKSLFNTVTGCLEWIGRTDRKGYGIIGLNKKTAIAHRLVWVLFKKSALGKLQVLHRCDNPKCINLKHLFTGTHIDNMTDMVNKGRSPDNEGESNPNSILTVQNVNHIRGSRMTVEALALLYKVAVATIKDVRGGRTWKNI